MEHGATQTEDVTVLFITNKKFEIWYEKSVGACAACFPSPISA